MTSAGQARVSSKRRRLLPTGGLWQQADFLRIWGAESISLFGNQVSALALPLLAVLVLDASALQMGLLAAAGTAPFLLCSLPAGVWVDRRLRRPILIVADYARAVLLLSVPLAYFFDVLSLAQLYVVAFVAGALGVVFEVAHYAFVPSLVGRAQVMDANSKLQISHSAADAAGPGVAGMLIQAASAPFALVIDALSFVASGLLVQRVRTPEPPLPEVEARGLRADVVAGMRALLGYPLLRPIVLTSITWVLFHSAIIALYVLYATRELGIDPFMLGLIFVAGGLGSIPGALLSVRVAERFGIGPATIGCWFLSAATLLAIPLAGGTFAVPVLAAAMLLGGITNTIANIQQWSLRQIVTPDELQGRVTASHRFLVYGAMPIGALLGGVLGDAIGLRTAILIGAVGVVASPLWSVFSPLLRLREAPLVD